MASLLTAADVLPFAPGVSEEQLYELVDGASALAVQAAPCLKMTTDDDVLTAARHILRAVVLRWLSSNIGTVTSAQVSIDDASVTDRFSESATPRGSLLWPTEIAALQSACRGQSGLARTGWLC